MISVKIVITRRRRREARVAGEDEANPAYPGHGSVTNERQFAVQSERSAINTAAGDKTVRASQNSRMHRCESLIASTFGELYFRDNLPRARVTSLIFAW